MPSIDTLAETAALYLRADCDLSNPPGPTQLARRLLGPQAVQEHAGIRAPAVYVRALGVIWVRPGLSAVRRCFGVAHELAEWHLSAYAGEDREDVCDTLAASLIAPAPAFRAVLHDVGRSLPDLARAFVTTQSIVALRLGEVTGSPLALVTPRRVIVRGDAWCWPRDVRRLAAGVLPREVERLPVTDASRRVALVAA